jgi:pseudouridine-5'-phosphate glycosidase
MKTNHFIYHPAVSAAINSGLPVVALETAVLTHGLPYPANVQLAADMEEVVQTTGALPATIGLLSGEVHVGFTTTEIEQLGDPHIPARKISRRDFGIAQAKKENGGTTVAGTMVVAHQAGIRVFATGGIGGVHRNAPFDVSADLHELAVRPLVVVCAGAKSILDLPATLEVLETQGVPVIGYQTDEFPAFFSRESGLPVTARVDSPSEIAQIAHNQWNMGLDTAVLVVNAPPAESALPASQVEAMIEFAVEEAHQKGIRGAAVTPYLLQRVNELSSGDSMRANLALLKNNAQLAALIAIEISRFHPANRSI